MKLTAATVAVTAVLAFVPSRLPAADPDAPAVSVGLPEGVAPLEDAAARRLAELLQDAEKLRGLKARRPIPAGVVEEKDLPAKIAEAFRQDLPPERLKAAEVGLKAFGLLPESLDLASYLPELLASQVAGYYDPERHYLSVVRRGAGGEPEAMEEMVLVHELTHALQDQAFDLESFEAGDPLSDEDAARTALVEGDASVVMFDFLTAEPAESGRGPAPETQGDKELAAAPAWLRETMEFSYVEGMLFCSSVRKKGGQELLDRAFRDDPPRSSEQILHPEKWHTLRDDPVLLIWPDLSLVLPGARKLAEGQLGELGIRILLREANGDRSSSERAAAGWGGDRFAVYEKDGRRLLAWITAWDSAADAGEFRSASRWLGRGWRMEEVTPRRVVVLRGPWKRSEARGVVAALAAVGAT